MRSLKVMGSSSTTATGVSANNGDMSGACKVISSSSLDSEFDGRLLVSRLIVGTGRNTGSREGQERENRDR